MSHPYDASTKYLIETRLADWLPLCGRFTTAELEVIDADLSTVTAAADRVLLVREDPHWLLHLELVSSRDDDLLPNLPAYNMLCRAITRSAWMRESVTYQAIVEEGRVEARQDDLLLLGRQRFGGTSAETESALRGIADADRLARLIAALRDASSWEELLTTP